MGRRVISILLMSATFLTACVCCAMEVAGDGSDDYGVLNDKLYAAARRGQVDRVRFLIDSGADPNAHHPMRLGETPLHAAVKAANPALIRLLIEEFHVDRSAQDETGKTPLHLAIDLADRDTVRLLLERGVDSSVSDNAGETPLHKAVMAGDKCLVRKLIAAGASRDAVDIYCQTPLYQACAHGFTAAVRMLLDVCADPNRATHAPQRCRGQRSMTPLMVAIQRVRGKIVRMLLAPEVAVDLEARNDAGETVLDIARRVADDGERIGNPLGSPYGTRTQKMLHVVQGAVRRYEAERVRGRLYEVRRPIDGEPFSSACSLPHLGGGSSDSMEDAASSTPQMMVLPQIERCSPPAASGRHPLQTDTTWHEVVPADGDDGGGDEFPAAGSGAMSLPACGVCHW